MKPRFSAPAARRRRPSPLSTTCVLLLAALLATEAQAARWITVTPDKAAKVEIDASSVDRGSDGKVRAWHRETFTPRRLQEAWAFSYASLKQLSEFQCGKRLATPLRRIYFGETGNELRSEDFDAREALPVVPDTPLEAVFTRACKLAEPPKPSPPVEPPKPPPVVETPVQKRGFGKKQKHEEPPPPPPKPPVAWDYEGKRGARHWGSLDTDYATCGSGEMQSPIDIRNAIRADLPPLRIAYQPVPLSIVDDGHGIHVAAAGGGSITVDGVEYELQALHFHRPGEEMVNGKRPAMSVQFEHRAKTGQVAMLSVPLQEGKQEHRLVRVLWSALPLVQGKPSAPAGIRIDPGQLLPPKRDFYTFSGSLTRPPCTEGVLWVVMKHAVQLSTEQVADFSRIYKNNARPIQPTNGRVVKQSR